jgi:2-polyprenyl-3-methyl-5-hydroxy-6-metoxy-1,4-benzoquinol methylase
MPDRSVTEFFDSYSADFNALYGSRKDMVSRAIDRLFRKSMRVRFERTLQGCFPLEAKTVLDVGCGPGHYCLELAARGAASCLGLDFAPGMIRLAKENARLREVADRCEFICDDVMEYSFEHRFDYAVVMGFMDYVSEPTSIIDKILSLTKAKAFFSFPVADGILAWQRKQRYRHRCDLFLYGLEQVDELFRNRPCRNTRIDKISRDYFVTVEM